MRASKQTFFSRNVVAIVMIPSIIGIHYGWSLMQKNRTLVSANEEIELPAVTFSKYCWRQLQGLTGAGTNEGAVKAASSAAPVAAAK